MKKERGYSCFYSQQCSPKTKEDQKQAQVNSIFTEGLQFLVLGVYVQQEGCTMHTDVEKMQVSEQ